VSEFQTMTMTQQPEFITAAKATDSNGQPCWYAAYTRSRHEKQVARQLEEKAVESFLPLYEAVHRWKDRRARVQLPLFPGYVFVRLPLRERLKVLEIPSVVRLVGFNGKPAPLLEHEIETLRSGWERLLSAEPHPFLKVGQKVRITAGPLAGLEGILIQKKQNLRVVLSINLIMRSIVVDVDSGDIHPVQGRI